MENKFLYNANVTFFLKGNNFSQVHKICYERKGQFISYIELWLNIMTAEISE